MVHWIKYKIYTTYKLHTVYHSVWYMQYAASDHKIVSLSLSGNPWGFFFPQTALCLCACWYLYQAVVAAGCIISHTYLHVGELLASEWLFCSDSCLVCAILHFCSTLSQLYENPTVHCQEYQVSTENRQLFLHIFYTLSWNNSQTHTDESTLYEGAL